MDDLIKGLLGLTAIVAYIAFRVAVVVIGVVGLLIYELCELVLPPFYAWLRKSAAVICQLVVAWWSDRARRLGSWWYELTWWYRVVREQYRALRQIRAMRRKHVALAYALVDAIDREQIPTADATAAVRVAVRSAVRQG